MAFYRDPNSITPTIRPDSTDVDAVVQGVRNLISTRKGERPFRPDFGINIVDYLFELMDESAGLQLLAEILDAVTNYEPRVIIDRQRSEVTPDPDNNTLEVSLFFEVQGFEGNTFEVTESIRQ
jgi:phage baseplate assembly protein W